MEPANNLAIGVEELTKSYGSIQALKGANLEVSPAQVFGLVGPNGSGKTTLIKALCGILKPDSGSVRVLGLRADRDRYAVRKHLGYMPQSPALYEDLSPAENLRFFGGGFHVPDLAARLQTVLEFVQLWERRDDPLYTFSGGMRQRVSLACALLHDPELLLLDEPTAGVDPALRQDFWDHFTELRARGRTIFLSTNQMDEALRCDQVAVILDGRIIITETPEAIRDRGRARVTVELEDGVRSWQVAHYEEELPRLLAEFGLTNRVKKISVRRPSLEEVILELIGEAR
ncbi:MAG: ABC transporter ATP-binding protein [Thermoleophilia bacterium]